MNQFPDFQIVQKCLLEIEGKLGWGSSDQWHSGVFLELSEKVQETTNVLLSPTTLKRVWGKVSYQSAPSINTLNTLAQFAGYTNWRDYKSRSEISIASKTEKKAMSNLGIIMVSAAFMTILFISFFSMIGTEKDRSKIPNPESITFSSRPITDGLPNSVVFDLDLKGLQSDSIYIQQFWDVTKTIKIKANQKKATGIYYYPGYYRAKLVEDGKIIKEHDLFIKTKNWIATLDYEPIPKYVKIEDAVNLLLSLPISLLEEIELSSEPLVSSYHFVDDFKDFSGDDFLMETSIRHIYKDKWAVCQNTKIVILGTTGAMIIPFSVMGCVSDLGLMLNDVYLSGKEHDLSAFGFDFSDFRNITIQVQDKEVAVSVDGQKIYSASYTEPIGRLVGLRYRFLGAGEVGQLSITNDEGKIYDFDQ